MNKLQELNQYYEEAQEIAGHHRWEMISYLLPILEIFPNNYDSINSVIFNEKSVTIYFSWRAAGCDCSDSINLPMFIFDSKYPVKAAKDYKKKIEG